MMNEINAKEILEEIVDRLIPAKEMDAYEQAIYYFLVRESRLRGDAEVRISIKSLGDRLFMTRRAIEPRLRSLQTKGCVEIADSGWSGTLVRVRLPIEILGARTVECQAASPDIETIDFFTDRKYREAILDREGRRCFYCQKALTKDNWSLDHVEAQVVNGQNGYRNIVAACHSCNSSKNASSAEDFLRGLYRRGRLSDNDFDGRLAALHALREGDLKPGRG